MIVETAIVCATVVVVASLGAASRIVRLENEHQRSLLPKPRLTKTAVEEKKENSDRTENRLADALARQLR